MLKDFSITGDDRITNVYLKEPVYLGFPINSKAKLSAINYGIQLETDKCLILIPWSNITHVAEVPTKI